MRLILRASLPKVFHLGDLVDPLFQSGQPNWCFENARREYWLRKEAGDVPRFVYGIVTGVPIQSNPGEEWAAGHPIDPHAFIIVRGRVVDPTRFRVGSSLIPANQYWKSVTYQVTAEVAETDLSEPLAPETFFN